MWPKSSFSRVRSLEKKINSGYGRIRLKDGSIYRYDPDKAGGQLWAYCIDYMIRGKYGTQLSCGEEPEILTMIRKASNPKAAMAPFRPVDPTKAMVDPGLLLEEDTSTLS
jgi:hypothetical protein